jgi:hypothetical protein
MILYNKQFLLLGERILIEFFTNFLFLFLFRAENSPEKKTKTKFSASQNAIPLYVVTVSKNDQHSLSLWSV